MDKKIIARILRLLHLRCINFDIFHINTGGYLLQKCRNTNIDCMSILTMAQDGMDGIQGCDLRKTTRIDPRSDLSDLILLSDITFDIQSQRE